MPLCGNREFIDRFNDLVVCILKLRRLENGSLRNLCRLIGTNRRTIVIKKVPRKVRNVSGAESLVHVSDKVWTRAVTVYFES